MNPALRLVEPESLNGDGNTANGSIAAAAREPVQLRSQRPLTRGRNRLVYDHPEIPDALIKVVPNRDCVFDFPSPDWQPRWKKSPKLRFYHPHTITGREVGEYLRLRVRVTQHPDCLPRFWGWVETDIGLGMVVEKLTDADGNLAPTIRSLITENRFTREHQILLEESCRRIFAFGLQVSDFNLRNFVYASSRDGKGRVVLVDGLGDKTLLALESLSERLVARGNMRRYRRMLKELPIISETDNSSTFALVH